MRERTPVLLVVSLVLALLFAGCTVGSGDLITESRDVTGFDEIVLMTSGDVNVEVTGTESLEVEAEDNIMPLLTTEVVNGRLELGASEPFSTTRRITYTITAAELVGVAVAGSGDVDASGIDTDSFEATVSGSGNLDLSGTCATFEAAISGSGSINPSGTCTDLAVTVTGSGKFRGDELEAATGTVTVSGSGDAEVNVSDDLDVRISGSGDVRYRGDPSVSQNISGSGGVSRR